MRVSLGKLVGVNMKFIVIIGIISSAVNIFIYHNNDAALWGWLSSTAWASALLIHELMHDK